MKILMLNRPTAYIASGGDVLQMESTRRYLQQLGHVVDVSLAVRPDVSAYDIVHVFNMQSGTMPHSFFQIEHAKRHNKPVVLSTIYWTQQELDESAQSELQHLSASRGKRLKVLLRTHPRDVFAVAAYAFDKYRYRSQNAALQKRCLELADALLPNTQAEKVLLMHDFNIEQNKFHIIPNAAEGKFYGADAASFINKYQMQDFVLCVARIEPRKNQLRLLKVLRELNLPAVFIGKIDQSSAYVQKCLSYADAKVLFINHIPQDQLAPAYAAAKVHALVSWYETPGLSSLEAGLAGANIVSTSRGGTREYFQEMAFYCEPDDEDSIRLAIQSAWKKEKDDQLKEHIKLHFTWERVAQLTEQVYAKVL